MSSLDYQWKTNNPTEVTHLALLGVKAVRTAFWESYDKSTNELRYKRIEHTKELEIHKNYKLLGGKLQAAFRYLL